MYITLDNYCIFSSKTKRFALLPIECYVRNIIGETSHMFVSTILLTVSQLLLDNIIPS